MIIIISSSKTMREKPSPDLAVPFFNNKTEQIRKNIQNLTQEHLANLYHCSLAKANEYRSLLDITTKTRAIDAFNGVVFKQFSKTDLVYLNQHVRIISAFYGLLKPNDGISPYRLDMNDNLQIDNKNLYHFWNKEIYQQLNDHLIINLASEEYAKCIRNYLTSDDIFIDIDFIEIKDGKKYKSSTQIKKARGLFLSFLITNHIENINDLKLFNLDHYIYDSNSTSNKLTFFKRT